MELNGLEFRAIVFNAARDNHLARLKVFLEEPRSPAWLEGCLNNTTDDRIPLVIAARNGNVDVAKYLVSKGASANVRGTVSFDGETIMESPPLWAAAAAGHVDMVKYLVGEAGAYINLPTNTNSTPLRGACYDGHTEIVKYLVEQGADIEIANRHGHTPLMIGCFRGKSDVVEFLLSKGADVTKTSVKGNTALHDAAEGDHVDICEMLIKAGAELKKDDNGLCPLMSSALLGNEAVIPVLLNLCMDPVGQSYALKLLGCTRGDKKMDLLGAVEAWKRAVQLPLTEEQRQRISDDITKFNVSSIYGGYKEVETLDDVQDIVGVIEAIHMQALLIRERLLGGGHVDVHYFLRFRGAVYCDLGRVSRCFELWQYALRLQQRHTPPLSLSTLATLQAFQETFGMAVNEHAIHQDIGRANWPLRAEQVVTLFDLLTYELERLVDWGKRPLYEECCGDDHHHNPKEDKDRLVLVGLQLLLLIYRLDLPSHLLEREVTGQGDADDDASDSDSDDNDVAVQVEPLPESLKKKKEKTHVDVSRFVTACHRLGLNPLHLALEENERAESTQFPANFVVECLLKGGADVRTTDSEGNTPLHVLLLNERPKTSIVSMLLEHGAPLLARNHDDNTCLDLIELSRLGGIKTGRHLSLAGLAANVVRRQLPPGEYFDIVPADLVSFVDIH